MKKLIAAALIATPAYAEPRPDLFQELAVFDGREVQVSGNLLDVGFGDASLQTGRGLFTVNYALPPQDVRQTIACISRADRGCRVSLLAEVQIEGSSISLLAFDIQLLQD